MFLNKEDLGSVIYNYQIDQITEGNDDLVLNAIAAAIDQVKSYLTGNNQREWIDGRIVYDVEAIFNSVGAARNPLILAHTKTITKWWIVELCNADVIQEQAEDRYDKSVAWLNQLAKGEVTLSTLPVLEQPNTEDEEQTEPFRSGSRKKFNHE
ncbi:phage protein Gp36 family protein [Wenyingzhuangia aestuarii]|uniref:phage protein Gp36 family protein n=1 Tax=Wenyingzhuangia aestuarii TaxID=1647582 RepID=UPI00143AE07D|nr:phage protein Gp36 family protein [Wenyingzhuangia aestuarii]NJB83628.1 hypothetical protein [Wenyingzhuangia aestuarii]